MSEFISDRVESLFWRALDLPSAERKAFLEQACGTDHVLLCLVTSLIQAADRADEFFRTLGSRFGLEQVLAGESELPPGESIGPFRLLRLLGRGGMGAVYLAERADQQFEQQVALKILPIGLSGEESHRYFLAERQILARLVHPNIARLLDGGVAKHATPYFVMDLVDGQHIDQHCDAHHLNLNQRIELLLQAADAVAYAHSKLIVHRDIKPANVLVDQSGVVKLVDFGIAKLLAGSHEETLTNAQLRPLSLAYASPEAVQGEPAGTAMDIYSLGVLLYRLLTGSRPFEFDQSDALDLRRQILETQPLAPSKMVAKDAGKNAAARQLAADCGTDTAGLARRLRGDLDTIVIKALAKQPAARYQTVEQFSTDLRRFQQHLPVIAQPPSWSYRLRKFVRRHKGWVVSGATIALLLAAIVAVTANYALTTERQAEAIALERDIAVQTREFMVSVFESSHPDRSAGETISARELLDQGAKKIELIEQPAVRAELLETFGDVYDSLALYEHAQDHYQRALDIWAQLSGQDGRAYVDALYKLGFTQERLGDYQATRALAEQGLKISRAVDYPGGIADHLELLASASQRLGERDNLAAMYRESLTIRRRLHGPNHPAVADSLSSLGTIEQGQGNLSEARTLHQQALSIRRDLFGNDNLSLIESWYNLGVVARGQQRLDDAAVNYKEALRITVKLNPDGSADEGYMHNGLGLVYRDLADYQNAALSFERSADIWRDHFGHEHPNLGFALANLGEVRFKMGDITAARETLNAALRIIDSSIPEHPVKHRVGLALGEISSRQREFVDAEHLLLASHRGLTEAHGEADPKSRRAALALAELYHAWGKPAQAARYESLK